MKKIKKFVIATIALVSIAGTASAQLTFGVKAGAKFDELNFKSDDYVASNTSGYTVGLMMEYMFPSTNVGLDVSLMYSRVKLKYIDGYYSVPNYVDMGMDYIDMPINFKWKVGLPVARNIVTPYLFTGPNFSFLAGGKYISDLSRKKSVDVNWNVGVGVQLFDKVQVGACYGWGLNNILEMYHINWSDIDCKKNSWTITATYLF